MSARSEKLVPLDDHSEAVTHGMVMACGTRDWLAL